VGGWSEEEAAAFIEVVAGAASDKEAAKRGEGVRYTAKRLAVGGPVTGWPHLTNVMGEEVIRKVRSWLGLQSAPESPTVWEPPLPFADVVVPPFPTEALPPTFKTFVEQEAEALQVPPDLPGVLVLGVGATPGAGRCAVQVNEGWTEPINGFLAVALDSGERKSPAYRDTMAPLEEREQELAAAAAPAIEAARVAWEVMNTRVQQAKKDAAKAKTEEERRKLLSEATELGQNLGKMTVPVVPRLLADDITSEALASLLADHSGRIALMSTEGGIFETMARRYSDGNLNLDVYLKGYSGDQLRVDRKSRPPEFVPHPMLTVCLAVQPTIISGLALKPGFRGRGLIARFLFSLPASRVGFRNIDPPPLPVSTRKAYHAAVKAVLCIPDNEDGKPHLLQLSSPARVLFKAFQGELEPKLAPGAELHSLRDWCLKLPGAIARLAGILHLLANAEDAVSWKNPINKMTMAFAITLGRYFTEHAIAAFVLMGSEEATDDAKYVLAWIHRSGASSFSKQEVWQATKGRFAKVAPLNVALGILIERGYLRERVLENQGRGRKPAPLYEINPMIGSYNSEDGDNSRDSRTATAQETESPEPSAYREGQPPASNSEEDSLEI
jgi:replicative DNA helicase